jgi:hypothetical protein
MCLRSVMSLNTIFSIPDCRNFSSILCFNSSFNKSSCCRQTGLSTRTYNFSPLTFSGKQCSATSSPTICLHSLHNSATCPQPPSRPRVTTSSITRPIGSNSSRERLCSICGIFSQSYRHDHVQVFITAVRYKQT